MKPKTLNDEILELEAMLDLQSFTYKNEKIWALVRIFILLARPKTNKKIYFSFQKRISFLFSGFMNYMKWKFVGRKKSFYVFLSSSHYKVEEKGKSYDRIIDPFINWLSSSGKEYSVFEFTNHLQYDPNISYRNKQIKIQSIFYFLSFLWKIKFLLFSPKKHFNGDFIKLKKLLEQNGIKFNVNKNFYWRVYLLEKQSILFEKMLSKMEAQRVGIVCYYDFKSLALTWAANRLGIPSIDFQHGVQGPNHPAYGQWSKKIADNSIFLPSHFWVWDEFSYETISKWKNPNNIILGCNKWMLERVVKLKPEIILFTSQPLEDPLPYSLIEGIKRYKGNLKWYIRLHPHQINEMKSFENLLESEGILQKVNLKEATFKPLSELLAVTQLHITKSSSVAIEASYFNVSTVFLEEQGYEIYKDQLAPYLISYLESKKSLNNCIINSQTFNNRENIIEQDLFGRFNSIEHFF